jgi:hypothetical protein
MKSLDYEPFLHCEFSTIGFAHEDVEYSHLYSEEI